MSQLEPVETNSVVLQTEVGIWDTEIDCQLTASLKNTEFNIAEFEQEHKDLPMGLHSLKISVRCANRSRAKTNAQADRAEFRLEISEKVTSDFFEDNKEVTRQLREATSKAK